MIPSADKTDRELLEEIHAACVPDGRDDPMYAAAKKVCDANATRGPAAVNAAIGELAKAIRWSL